MNSIIIRRSFFLLLITIIIIGCGNKKAPTGGKKDVINPTIISISPEEFSDISNIDLEIIFSKPIDRNSILTGIHFYPPILQKKYKWDGNTLIIEIVETLENDTNYFITFNRNIKGEHDNKLDQDYVYTFSSGKLSESRISGNFIYERDEDKNESVKLSLLSADSTFIYSKYYNSSAYSLDNLNLDYHVIRAYIDKNMNNRYDYEQEPFAQVITDSQDVVTADLELAYADTVKPHVAKAKSVYNNLGYLHFSEKIKSFESIRIFADSSAYELPVIIHYQDNDRLEFVTANMDTLNYRVMVFGMVDVKGNRQDSSSVVFRYSSLQDSFPPVVEKVVPRNGSTVSTLTPDISILFSEIIMESDFTAILTEIETGDLVKLKIVEKSTRKYMLKPSRNLTNYSSYRLTIDFADVNKISALEPYETIFIPIVREK